MTADRSVTLPENAAGGAADTAPAPSAVPARSWTIELPPGTPILTANQRMHWAPRNDRTQMLKQAVVTIAHRRRIPRLGPVTVLVEYVSPPRYKPHRHPLASDVVSDHDNLAPLGKALVDGCVLAGILPVDSKRIVRSVAYHLADETHPRGIARITLTEVTT